MEERVEGRDAIELTIRGREGFITVLSTHLRSHRFHKRDEPLVKHRTCEKDRNDDMLAGTSSATLMDSVHLSRHCDEKRREYEDEELSQKILSSPKPIVFLPIRTSIHGTKRVS